MDGIKRESYRQQHTERAWNRSSREYKEEGGAGYRSPKIHQEGNQFLASILIEKTSREKISQSIRPGEKLKRGNHEKTFALLPVLDRSMAGRSSCARGWPLLDFGQTNGGFRNHFGRENDLFGRTYYRENRSSRGDLGRQ